MSESTQFAEVLELALRLSLKERIQLIVRVAASLEPEMDATPVPKEHWGQALNKLIDSLDTSDWEALDMDDPVEWINDLRRKDLEWLDPYWDGSN